MDSNVELVQRIMRASPWTESVREINEVLLVDRIQYFNGCSLGYLVLQRRHAKRSLPPVAF